MGMIEADGRQNEYADRSAEFISLHNARKALREIPFDEFSQLDILPVHLFFIPEPDNGMQSITLFEMANILRLDKPFRQIAAEFRMPESTLRQYGAVSLEFLRGKGIVDTGVVKVDANWQKVLREVMTSEAEYNAYLELEKDPDFIADASILSGLTLVNPAVFESDTARFLPFMQRYNGWDVNRQSLTALSRETHRSERRISALESAGRRFLNEHYDVSFATENSRESDRILKTLDSTYGRLKRVARYLTTHEEELLPVERLVLERYMRGETVDTISEAVGKMQVDHKQLIAEPGSVNMFLRHVLGKREGGSPFIKVRMAYQAGKALEGKDLSQIERDVLEGIQKGVTYGQIASVYRLHFKDVQGIAQKYGIYKNRTNYLDRDTVAKERKSLFSALKDSKHDWKLKERDLEVMSLLSADNIPTFKDVAKVLKISEDMVADSVRRARGIANNPQVSTGRLIAHSTH